MLCEMCGAESANLEPRKVSGSVLRLCSSCGEMGSQTSFRESIGHRAYVSQALEKRRQRDRYEELEPDEYVLVSNYGSRVRRAREKKGLGHANLAIKISEKKSILTSVEAGNMKPNEKLIKKLENALGIKLLEKVEVQSSTSSNQTNKALTMGDLLKQAMDKQ
tara:strand:+ start:386 stop:874 length:489 start_codon:yes stop_codon:yes gene_type:complete